MRNRFVATLAAATLSAGLANAESYVCHIKPRGQALGLISETITVEIDASTWNAVVSDSIIRAVGKKFAVATVTTFSDKRITVWWVVHGVKDRKNRIYSEINNKLVIWRARGNKADVTSNVPHFFEGSIRNNKELTGSGKCERHEK